MDENSSEKQGAMMIWDFLKTLFARRSGNNSSPILEHETCRRFLFDKKHFKAGRVTHQAFAVNKKTGNVSVFVFSRFSSTAEYLKTKTSVAAKRTRDCKAEA